MNENIFYVSKRGPWPEAVSDGLTLPCGFCGDIPKFDYRVDDDVWISLIPKHYQLGVVCLGCIDTLAAHKDIVIGKHIKELQFTGLKHTVIFDNPRIYIFRD